MAMTATVLILDKDAQWMCEQLALACPSLTFLAADSEDKAICMAGQAQILIALAPWITARLVATMPQLTWIHALTTGYDNLLDMTVLAPDVVITNSRGIHGPQMAELAVLSMLSMARNFPAMLDNQRHHRWERWPQPLMLGKTVCIIGLGVIAEALAARSLPFGAVLTGVSDGRRAVDGFSRIYPRREITTAVAEADFVVVVVPYSEQTHHIIDDAVMTAMKPSAHLVNIARGGCVDEVALLHHLDRGAIAGAALDVFASEPLPADHRFWSHPRVLVTPHIGGMSDVYAEQVLPLTQDNLCRFAATGLVDLLNRVPRNPEIVS
ncbi:D-2-hydroxyacid dehydrogenase [Devosia sp.]|uniref:D-2-hydroxyacid dehydrogenase n=1 Tax=Devosia sp. TaxID=1871048 RepID=UPI002736D9F7|nr:D-2-hydroxyacid dehydrogenase [Devosia sp.]MDP2779647.1 D-2-hydroxyacid dehydrogenase [Devosia sp.]